MGPGKAVRPQRAVLPAPQKAVIVGVGIAGRVPGGTRRRKQDRRPEHLAAGSARDLDAAQLRRVLVLGPDQVLELEADTDRVVREASRSGYGDVPRESAVH